MPMARAAERSTRTAEKTVPTLSCDALPADFLSGERRMDEREEALVNARSEARMDDFPPLNFDSTLDAIQAVEGCQSVADMGIAPICVVRATAWCSKHGEISAELDVDLPDNYEGGLRCVLCTLDGLKRICSVVSVDRLR